MNRHQKAFFLRTIAVFCCAWEAQTYIFISPKKDSFWDDNSATGKIFSNWTARSTPSELIIWIILQLISVLSSHKSMKYADNQPHYKSSSRFDQNYPTGSQERADYDANEIYVDFAWLWRALKQNSAEIGSGWNQIRRTFREKEATKATINLNYPLSRTAHRKFTYK